jgi:hypothetical protein
MVPEGVGAVAARWHQAQQDGSIQVKAFSNGSLPRHGLCCD